MKHLLTFLLALTCTALHAQSVIVKGTGAGSVRGTGAGSVRGVVTEATVTYTNLTVSGSGLNPEVSGVYTQIVDLGGYSAWGSTNSYFVHYGAAGAPDAWRITMTTNDIDDPVEIRFYHQVVVTGTYAVWSGFTATGTPEVVYSYTNK